MEDLVLKKNASSPICRYFRFEAGEKGKPKDLNEAICHLCRKQVMIKQTNTTNLCSPSDNEIVYHKIWAGQYHDIKFWIPPKLILFSTACKCHVKSQDIPNTLFPCVSVFTVREQIITDVSLCVCDETRF